MKMNDRAQIPDTPRATNHVVYKLTSVSPENPTEADGGPVQEELRASESTTKI